MPVVICRGIIHLLRTRPRHVGRVKPLNNMRYSLGIGGSVQTEGSSGGVGGCGGSWQHSQRIKDQQHFISNQDTNHRYEYSIVARCIHMCTIGGGGEAFSKVPLAKVGLMCLY